MPPKGANLLEYSEQGRDILSKFSSAPLEGFATHSVDVSISEFMKDSNTTVEKGRDYLLWHLINVEDVLQDIAGDEGPLATIEAKKDHIAFMNACRGAVKANQSLSLPEMRRLLEDMRRIPNPWACVHGRPTSLRIPIDSLDHHFGRHG